VIVHQKVLIDTLLIFDTKEFIPTQGTEKKFIIHWRQSKDPMEYCYLTLFEWENDNPNAPLEDNNYTFSYGLIDSLESNISPV
jgi:hypothetical protein